jgi:hypothetical protein
MGHIFNLFPGANIHGGIADHQAGIRRADASIRRNLDETWASSVMFKQLAEVVLQTLFLLRDVEQNKKDIATLKEQLAETNQLLRQLAFEFQRLSERERREEIARMLGGVTVTARARAHATEMMASARLYLDDAVNLVATENSGAYENSSCVNGRQCLFYFSEIQKMKP